MDLSDPLTQVLTFLMLEVTLAIAILTIAILRNKKQPSAAKDKQLLLNNPHSNVSAPLERIQQLESEKEALRNEPSKHKPNLSGTIAYAFLFSGIIALIASIAYSSSILAFIGLGLAFWGALLLFIKPAKYVKASLLDSITLSSLTSIDQIITGLDYKGKAIYLPPKYLKALKGGKVFIPSKKHLIMPPAEEVAEERTFLRNPKGILLTPPGVGLANLYESELGKDFAIVDLNYLQKNLPKLFVEDLEIAEDLEMSIENDRVHVRITGSIYRGLCEKARKLSNVCNSIGCPLCSSIAIALTRVSGEPVIIEKTEVLKDDETIEAYYRIIEE